MEDLKLYIDAYKENNRKSKFEDDLVVRHINPHSLKAIIERLSYHP